MVTCFSGKLFLMEVAASIPKKEPPTTKIFSEVYKIGLNFKLSSIDLIVNTFFIDKYFSYTGGTLAVLPLAANNLSNLSVFPSLNFNYFPVLTYITSVLVFSYIPYLL